MKERGVWLVPQAYLMVEGGGIDPASLEPAVRRKLAEIEPRAKFSYEQAIQSGVKIAFSTDGPLQKNDPWREFVALVARGMTPVQAIQKRHDSSCGVAGSRGPWPARTRPPC
jgi:imidazolonepropionase-like amidohydrolase